MTSVTLRGVSRSIGGRQVLRDVDLDVADGSLTVIVGPSGCGKSTLLRAIAGLEPVDSGEVMIGDRVVNDVPPADRRIAMVFQSYALYPHKTVYQNLTFGLKLAGHGRDEIERRVSAATRTLAIEGLLERKPAELSGGEQQRVAIGRAIVRHPRVFLFDEPLSNLDAELKVRMRYEFARLHEFLETTMVYVTHDQVEAMTLADRLVVMRAGSIEQQGEPMELYRRPVNRFVASFIGMPRMNFLPATFASGEDGLACVRIASGATLRVAADAGTASPGDPVTIGVRPEHLSADATDNRLDATLQLVESLGSSSVVYWQRDDLAEPLVGQVFGQGRYVTGDAATIGFAPGSAYLFDADGNAFATPG